MKKILFLNEEDERDVKVMVISLLAGKCRETDFQEIGGLGVMVETKDSEKILFSLYRSFGYIETKNEDPLNAIFVNKHKKKN